MQINRFYRLLSFSGPKMIMGLTLSLTVVMGFAVMTTSFAFAETAQKMGALENSPPQAPPSTSGPAEKPSIFDKISSFASRLGNNRSGENRFLQPDEAFILSAETRPGVARVHWDITPGYYLYKDKFSFRVINNPSVTIGSYDKPPGKVKVDEAFGRSEVYYDEIGFVLPLMTTSKGAIPLELEVNYQGCADDGFCYPPITKIIPLTLTAAPNNPGNPGNSGIPNKPTMAATKPFNEQEQLSRYLATGKLWLIALSFYGFGLLLAFTPCVFPMVPILSSIIVGQGNNLNAGRAFFLSAVYVLPMAVTYTLAGIIAASFGKNLQIALQNPWMIGSFSAIFIILALSMFGFYELQMPSRWQSRLSGVSHQQKAGAVIGVAMMGFLSALIVGPCVSAPLAAALIYIGQTGDQLLGGSALFAMSLGMGTPLLAIGTSAGKLLPKAGPWMDTIKSIFGTLLIAVAIWMLERILAPQITLALWAILFIVIAVYMGALERLKEGISGWYRLWKGVGLVSLVYGVILAIGALSGGKDIFHPLEQLGFGQSGGQSTTASSSRPLEFQAIKGLSGLQQALKIAQNNQQPAMLDLYADWCVSCKELERYTFSNPGVQQALEGVLLIQADVTLHDKEDKALYEAYSLIGPPTILFFDQNGQELKDYRLVGFLHADEFRQHALSAFGSTPRSKNPFIKPI